MSLADYNANFEDHSSILVLILTQKIDDDKLESVSNVIKRINKVRSSRQSSVHAVNVKYLTEYSTRKNDWYEFQAHRAVLGIITVGEYKTQELQASLNRHGELIDPYNSTVIDSRCILVGKGVPENNSQSPVSETDCPNNMRKKQCLFYPPDGSGQLEGDIQDFISNILWVMESKRVRLETDTSGKAQLSPILKAPFEKRDLIGVDTESRPFRKRILARYKKHLADISLQLGLIQEALSLYSDAMETLKSVGDILWLGAVYEGQCAASVGHLPSGRGLQRNQSFPMRARRNTPVGNIPTLSHAGSCKSLPVDVDPVEAKQFGRDLLTLEEIVDKVKEINANYDRYSNAIGPQIEVNLKLTRLLGLYEKRLQAAEFLQAAIVYSCRLNEVSWKLGWYEAVADLYREIGCLRKSAFYTRIGAVQAATTMEGIKPNHALCYQLMVKCMLGYQVDLLAPNPYEGRRWHPFLTPHPIIGWSRLQTTLLTDLILTAERQANGSKLAAHHCVFYLCYMFPFLEPNDAHQIAKKLDRLTADFGPISLSGVYTEVADVTLPDINLINYPLVTKVKPLILPASPVKWKSLSANQPDGGTPFIWAPANRNKNQTKHPGIEGGGLFASKWVKGEVACCEMILHNAATFAVQLTNLKLITEGPFDCYPTSITIGPSEKPTHSILAVKIQGTPRSTGEVRIMGYECTVLGVKTHCLFKDMTWMHRKVTANPYDDPNDTKNFEFIINIVPELPLLEVTGDLQSNSDITVYAGQKKSYRVKLHNKSSVPVESLDICIEGSRKVLVEWDEDEVKDQLPIGADVTATFHITLTGSENFIAPRQDMLKCSSAAPSPLNTPRQRRFQSTPNTPHKNSLRYDNNPLDTVSAQINITYSGGAGMEDNYARQCSIKTRLTVLPSMVVAQWDVLLADSPTQCYLVLDIENKTQHEMDLEYQEGKSIVVEKACKIPVLMPRCKPSGGEVQLEQACRDHIEKHVKLKWSLSNLQISGYATLSECRWTPAQVDTILSASLACEVFLQKRLYNVDDEFILKMGIPLSIEVEAVNTSLCPLSKLLVSLRVYQDYQNGTQCTPTGFCFHGSSKIPLENIDPGQKVKVEFCLLFFYVGDFKIDVDCVTESVDCARAVCSQVGDDEPKAGHSLWKTCSPLEITVVDLERDPLLSVPL